MALDMFRKKTEAESDHPKVYIPGNVYFIYKAARLRSETSDASYLRQVTSYFSGDDSSKYVVEKSDRKMFVTVPLRSNMIFHHFPDRHEKGLRSVRVTFISWDT